MKCSIIFILYFGFLNVPAFSQKEMTCNSALKEIIIVDKDSNKKRQTLKGEFLTLVKCSESTSLPVGTEWINGFLFLNKNKYPFSIEPSGNMMVKINGMWYYRAIRYADRYKWIKYQKLLFKE